MRRRALTSIVVLAVLAAVLPCRASASARQQPHGSSARTASGSQTAQATSIEYKNPQYSFCFTLPKSWKGYSILTDQWKGYDNNGPHGEETVATGPMISIRHPQWTSADPRQDIPIMVFTISQWNALLKDKFIVSAAPIGPGELGRNRTYVFGLPPRFDYAFPTGYEEVEQIIQNKSLNATCKAR
jgi:hypothetical protein